MSIIYFLDTHQTNDDWKWRKICFDGRQGPMSWNKDFPMRILLYQSRNEFNDKFRINKILARKLRKSMHVKGNGENNQQNQKLYRLFIHKSFSTNTTGCFISRRTIIRCTGQQMQLININLHWLQVKKY